MSMFMAGMLPHDMKGMLAEEAIKAIDSGEAPVAVQMNWPTPKDSHFLMLDRLERTTEGAFVVLRNPWGQEERVPSDAFKDHLTGVVLPY